MQHKTLNKAQKQQSHPGTTPSKITLPPAAPSCNKVCAHTLPLQRRACCCCFNEAAPNERQCVWATAAADSPLCVLNNRSWPAPQQCALRNSHVARARAASRAGQPRGLLRGVAWGGVSRRISGWRCQRAWRVVPLPPRRRACLADAGAESWQGAWVLRCAAERAVCSRPVNGARRCAAGAPFCSIAVA